MTGLRSDRLDLGGLVAAVADAEHGAIVTFLGCTRREEASRPVVAIEYEAYEELTDRELAAVCAEARARFDATLACLHRVGEVAVGEPSVAIAASAGHRAAAFAACRYVIDEIKARAPIWKRMRYEDGTSEWIDGRDAVAHERRA